MNLTYGSPQIQEFNMEVIKNLSIIFGATFAFAFTFGSAIYAALKLIRLIFGEL